MFHRPISAECRRRLLRASLTHSDALAPVLVVSSASAAWAANYRRRPEASAC